MRSPTTTQTRAPEQDLVDGHDSLGRMRFHYYYMETEDDYGRVWVHKDVRPDPTGAALTSLVRPGHDGRRGRDHHGTDQHAPVLDADGPVTTTPTSDGGTAVTFTGKFNRRNAINQLTDLIHAGLASQATRTEVERLTANLGRWRRERQITVTFDYEVIALTSKTPGHHHLLCQNVMSWDKAKKLSRALAHAGLTDLRHSQVSAAGDFMFVRRPR